MENIRQVLLMLERSLSHCSLSFSEARTIFKEYQPEQSIEKLLQCPEIDMKEIPCYLNQNKDQIRNDMRASLRTSNSNQQTFFKERRVFVGARDSVDRNAISDVYIHIRAWQFELEQGRAETPCVPHIYNVYGFWNNKKKEFWIGVEQEALEQENTLYKRIVQGLIDGTAEDVTQVSLIKLLTALRRFQEKFWLIHNDLHLNNVFIRNDGTPVFIDFDHASYYLEGVNGHGISYTYHHYQHCSIWARDVQQLINDALHALTNTERKMLDTHPFLNKLRALGSTYGSAETDTFQFYLEYLIESLLDKKKRNPLPETVKKLNDAQWFLKNPRGTLRAVSPASVQFGIVGEFYNAIDVSRVLLTDVSQFNIMEEVMKCAAEGLASDWALLEYVSKTLPTIGSTAEMAEWQWMPIISGVDVNNCDAWQDVDFKNFVQIWTRYNLGPLWLHPDYWFSMSTKSVPKNRRFLYFTIAVENLQRVAALFYRARTYFDANSFYLMYACHVALFGQSPCCTYEAVYRILWEGKGSPQDYTRENLPEPMNEFLLQYVKLDLPSWSSFTKKMYELAAEIRWKFLPDVKTLRSTLVATGSIRSLFGNIQYEEFILSCGFEKEIETLTTNACLGATHPKILGTRFLTMNEWKEKINLSKCSYKTNLTNLIISSASNNLKFGASL